MIKNNTYRQIITDGIDKHSSPDTLISLGNYFSELENKNAQLVKRFKEVPESFLIFHTKLSCIRLSNKELKDQLLEWRR